MEEERNQRRIEKGIGKEEKNKGCVERMKKGQKEVIEKVFREGKHSIKVKRMEFKKQKEERKRWKEKTRMNRMEGRT